MIKKRLRDMSWEDYGISIYRYKELKAFCLQYPEKKEKLEYGLKAAGEQIANSGQIGRPTENQAVKNSHLSKDCMMIEEAAKVAASDLYPWILASVTEGLSYDELEAHTKFGKVPICKKDFYGIRRKFYALLHQKKT